MEINGLQQRQKKAVCEGRGCLRLVLTGDGHYCRVGSSETPGMAPPSHRLRPLPYRQFVVEHEAAARLSMSSGRDGAGSDGDFYWLPACSGQAQRSDRPSLVLLSCLLGSEQGWHPADTGERFLSCLHGSERKPRWSGTGISFLSCLYGSEHVRMSRALRQLFLSCLRGSEPQPLAHRLAVDF